MSTPGGQGQGPDESRAEQVLSQALRAMAGGEKSTPRSDADDGRRPRLTMTQLLLIAAIVGLLIGAGAGLLTLLL